MTTIMITRGPITTGTGTKRTGTTTMATAIMGTSATIPKACDHESHAHDNHDHGGLKHYHDETMGSLSVTVDGDVDPDKFMPWIQDYMQREGGDILRSKGILAFKGEPRRFVYQGVPHDDGRGSPARMEAGREANQPHRLHRPAT